nr:pentatricopeptide repeat-containing protein At1g52620-like [Malus domestica]
MSLDNDALLKILTKLSQGQDDHTQAMHNTNIRVDQLEKQIGQIADFVGKFRDQGQLPSSTIPNPKEGFESAKAITLRSGKEVGTGPTPSKSGHKEDEKLQFEKEESSQPTAKVETPLPQVSMAPKPSNLSNKEFDIEIKDKKGSDNVVADHLSRLVREEKILPISETFPDEQLLSIQAIWPDYLDFILGRWLLEDGSAYSSLLKLLARFRVLWEIDLVMDNVKLKEVKPTHDALSLLIRAYAALDLYDFVVKVYVVVPSVFACNSLLIVLVKNRRVDVANRVYDKMAERCDGEHLCMDNFSTCIMVKGLCKVGRLGKVGEGDVKGASEIFKELKSKGFLPMLETFGAMINGYCEEGKFKAIDRLLMLMKERGLYINVQVHNNIVDARCKHDSLVKEVETVTKMIESGCEPDITTFHILIHNSCTGGKVQQAEQFINHAMERGLVPNEFSYTPLFHAYFRQREHSRALDLFTRMTERGQKPDLVSYGALILGLLVSGEVDVAMTVRDRMMENGVVLDSRIYNVLMSGLCKKGRLPTAKLLLVRCLTKMYQLMHMFMPLWWTG